MNMDHKKIIKFLKIIGLIFISLSVLEIAFILSLNFVEFDLNGSSILLSEFIYASSYISLTGTVLWFICMISMALFLILGFFIFKTARANTIESKSLAKLMIVIGMVILLGAFIKMNYLIQLGKTTLFFPPAVGYMTFQTALYRPDITPLMPAIFWVYFISVNCYLMIISLIITAFGIKWTLDIEQLESKDK